METGADRLIHVTACEGEVRVVAAVTTDLVKEACRRHHTSPTVSAALGRALTAGLLLGVMLKDVERLSLVFDCDGPVGGIRVDADAHGHVRGYVNNPSIDLPLNDKNKFDVRSLVGDGMLYLIREGGYYEMGVYQDAYRGSVPIVSGEIAEDVAYYLAKSEQIPSAVSLGVFVLPDEKEGFQVAGAGGLLVQVFPGASDEVVNSLEETIAAMPAVTELIRRGCGPRKMVEAALREWRFTLLEEKPVEFRCTCSYERALRIVSAMDRRELESMLREDGGAEMVCHYCNSSYGIDGTTLAEMLSCEA